MKVDEWLKRATKTLKNNGIGTARLDALVLLEDTMRHDRGWLLAHPEFELNSSQLKKLDHQIKSRAKHEPLAYIRGKTEFYGREFKVNKDVLEPRPESETMIELLKKLPLPKKLLIADIGTGSGALAIMAKLEMPDSGVLATDIDLKCLAIAKHNAQKLGADVKFFKGNLLEPVYSLLATPYVLLCNLPYVPDNYQLNSAAMNEPKIAIFGGPDGLDLYRRLFEQIDSMPAKPKYILTESLPPQHKKLAKVAKKHDYKLAQTTDFIQVFKNT
ncbi:peptide chain release factor N(5)-glutamine methyltransferase [Candidatus Saccharibacteria bacterium]|nr:peptide chain release factor N(5)-glutamine methyltransferase [Candidatus Saccharibacteria bacterium]